MTGTSLEKHQEGYTLPVAAPPHNEGNTTAGWAMAGIITAGVLVTCLGLILDNDTVAWVAGPIVGVIGLIVGFALRRAGKGQPSAPVEPVRDWYDTPADRGSAADTAGTDREPDPESAPEPTPAEETER